MALAVGGENVGIHRLWQRSPGRFIAISILLTSLGTSGQLGLLHPPLTTHAAAGCQLLSPGGAIQHVIYIQFDNTHFMHDIGRDGSTTVPSDLEQMPHLLNFIKGNGTLLSNHHTPLISHTSDDITTSETGVYPSRHGIATAANSYYYYDQTLMPQKTSGFSYWTSKIGDGQYNFTSAPNTNAPAPWVPFTRAGCNVGAVAMTGLVLENTTTDVATAFPNGAPASTNPFADFVGVAVHCAASDPLCSTSNGGVADVLPNEPNPDGSTDPLRTPTFTAFAQPDYYVEDVTAVPASLLGCATSPTPAAARVIETSGFNWNHGDVQPEIGTTWVGFVGPGVLNRGLDGPDPTAEARGIRFGAFSDHTDIRPTILALLGLHDDYLHDGRVLTELLDPRVMPQGLEHNQPLLRLLGRIYKKINAPVGQLGLDTLKISTAALVSANDDTFNALERRLTDIADQRDALVAQLQPLLDWTEPHSPTGDDQARTAALPMTGTIGLFSKATSLSAQTHDLAAHL